MNAATDYDALFASVRARREPLGLNVHFINSSGEKDSYSFATVERAEKFKAKLASLGLTQIEG